MSVHTLLATTPSMELAEWEAYHNLESFQKTFSERDKSAEDHTAALKSLMFRGLKRNG